MPWTHCGDDTLLDDEPCPTCGQEKGAWTVNIELTRVLRVGQATLELLLRDEGGDAVGGAYYSVRVADGKLFEGTLGDDGAARLASLKPGPCTVSFDDIAPEELVETGAFESFVLKPGKNARALTLRWSFDAEGEDQGQWVLEGHGATGPPPPAPSDDTPDDGEWELEDLDAEGTDADKEAGWSLVSVDVAGDDDDAEAGDAQPAPEVADDPFAAAPADDPFAT